ncbi:hypothetical protein JXB11_03470 [Candidatus Woesearchaeota archaeon]|nr:hypothetical protein [Candidatus Woesearchaeota archaeon]
MKRRRRKKGFDPANKRLDEFLTQLDIEAEKKKQIVDYFEKLTFEQLKSLGKR